MKTSFFKKGIFMALVVIGFVAILSSCSDDDDNNTPTGPIVLDGTYLVGDGTALTELSTKGKLSVARNEVLQEDRVSLYEIYIAVNAGSDGFNIVTVEGATQKTWGPGSDFAEVAADARDTDEPQDGSLQKGSLAETDTKFTVPTDGLYHVVIDTELGKAAVTEVKWGMIGAATPGGWGTSTEMTATFDLNKMVFEVAEVTLTASDWKFRYSNGWKVILDADYDLGDGNKGVKVNTNFGGSIGSLVAGGDNFTNDTYGIYKATLTWELGESTVAELTFVREGEPLPEFPEEIFLVGDGTEYGWPEPGTTDNAEFHKIAGGGDNTGVYWKIAHLDAAGSFKVSAAAWGDPNIGFAEVDEFDANGEAVSNNGGNMAISTSGMYTIVVDLRDDQIKLSVTPVKVYGIGDAFGGWEVDVAGNLFTVNNTEKTVVSPALPASANIRSYVKHDWIPDWWNAEFVPNEGTIEYRNDSTDDPSAIAGTAGQVITYTFDSNTCSID